MSSYPPELWTWKNCQEAVKSLPGRLGFSSGDQLDVLGYTLDLTNGSILDTLTGELLDVSKRGNRLVSNTIFYVLSAYADSEEKLLTGKLISSKQFRGAKFTGRDTMGERYRIIRYFTNITLLEKGVVSLGGSRIEFPYGDIAVSLKLLPYIPLTIILNLDDEEFPAETRLFYDETVENYLDSEQTYFLTSLAVSRIIHFSD
jgi:hypothetical protein